MKGKRRTDLVHWLLSARERALLCTRAALEGRSEDPLVRQTMPITQREEFNRYMARFNCVLHSLVPSAALLLEQAKSTVLRVILLQTISAWRGERLALSIAMELPGLISEGFAPGGESDDAGRSGTDRIRGDLATLWGSLRAHEQVVDEVISDFGEGTMIPDWLPTTLERTRAQLEALEADAQPLLGDIKRPPADPDMLKTLRAGLHRDERLYL